jgi:putative membrane protein
MRASDAEPAPRRPLWGARPRSDARRSPIGESPTASVVVVLKFAVKVIILGAVFYWLTRYDVLPGLDVIPNPEGPLGGFGTYLWIGLLFGVVNAIVGPVLRLLSLPFVLLTLGLFLLVVNAALLGLTALITDRLEIDGFLTALLGGLILAIASWVADQLLDR